MDIWGMLHTVSRADFIRSTIKVLETYMNLAFQQSVKHGPQARQFVVLFDMANFNVKQYTWRYILPVIFIASFTIRDDSCVMASIIDYLLLGQQLKLSFLSSRATKQTIRKFWNVATSSMVSTTMSISVCYTKIKQYQYQYQYQHTIKSISTFLIRILFSIICAQCRKCLLSYSILSSAFWTNTRWAKS